MGVDSRGRFNGGGDINIRQNKLNFTGSGVLNQRKSISEGITDRNNTLAVPSNIYNLQNSTNQGYFGFFRGGLDYFVDNRNTLSITANFNRGQFDNDQTQRVDSTIKGIKSSYSNIGTQSTSNFRNVGTQLSYKHNFMKNGHNISSDYNYNKSSNDNLSNINNYTYNMDGTQKGTPILQRGIGEGSTTNHTFQIDYENPLTEDKKFEAGGRVAIRDFNNKLDQFRFNSLTGQYQLVPLISSRYKYTDAVYAAYSTYSFRVNKWSYQLGLRAESSNYTGTLLNSNGADSATFSVKFPLSLFPSAFITYKIDEKQDFQINYSRRVNRPNFFQLMPFPDYSDPQNINVGNAGLSPEFTNSFEMSWNNAYKKGANFLATAFYKHSTNLITRYVYRDANALIPGDSAFFSTYINANSARSFGLELTNKMSITPWWEMTVNLNIFNSRINATVPGQPDLVQEQWSWFTKMNNTFKVAKGLSIQLSGDYQAKTVLPQSGGGGGRGGMMWGGGPQSGAQGFNLPRYGFDLAIRKEFTWKKGRTGIITLSMNDIFRTQLFQSYSESSFFNQTSQRRRDPQVLRLNFSYRFGKFDASLFKRKNTKADQSGGMDMMQQ
jgi:outer membrane receptor protein involved in Fe transport